jgi:WD40 repeat protein
VAGAAPGVHLYDAEAGNRIATCTGHSAGIYALAFSPDSSKLATGGFDGTVRLYNAADCKLAKAFVPVPITTPAESSGGAL